MGFVTMHGDDVWSEWLLHRRHADDPNYGCLVQSVVQGFADRVLDGAQLAAGMTLVDVGAGEGLVAFRAIDRIGPSKPGGRISIAEPILQDEALYARALRRRVDDRTSQSADRFLTLLHRWKAAQFPDTEEECAASPIANFSERDLLNMIRGAGFGEIHLQLHIDVMPSLITSWDVFIGTSPHPWAPPLRQIFAEQFTTEERNLFEKMVRPTVESGKSITTERTAYVQAQKPVP